jgi:putative peptidoglycan lipid II flippase
MGYGVGLLGLVAIKVLAPGFYARQDTRTPVKIAVVVLVGTQLLNVVLVPWLGHAGLALSIGVGAWVNAGLLLWGLLRSGAYRPKPGWGLFVVRVLTGCIGLGAGLYWAATAVDWLGLQARWPLRAALLAGVIAAAGLVYFGTLAAVGLRLRAWLRRA